MFRNKCINTCTCVTYIKYVILRKLPERIWLLIPNTYRGL